MFCFLSVLFMFILLLFSYWILDNLICVFLSCSCSVWFYLAEIWVFLFLIFRVLTLIYCGLCSIWGLKFAWIDYVRMVQVVNGRKGGLWCQVDLQNSATSAGKFHSFISFTWAEILSWISFYNAVILGFWLYC